MPSLKDQNWCRILSTSLRDRVDVEVFSPSLRDQDK